MATRPARSEPASPAPLSRRRARGAAALLACALCAGGVPAQDGDQQLEIIPLAHRLADELIPMLQPLLEPDGTLVGSGGQLIVRTSPANLAELREALAALDVRQQRLRVSVSQSRIGDSAYDSYGINAAAGGRQGGVAIGTPPGGPDTRLDAHIARTHDRDEGNTVQSVLTLDGQSAWVQVSDERPQPWVGQAQTPYGTVVQQGIDWQAARSGFYVTPRLRGDEVQIEISSQQQRFADDGSGRLATSGVDTVVHGRLGEWLPIGGSAETAAGDQNAVIAHTRRRTSTHSGFWVRVDVDR